VYCRRERFVNLSLARAELNRDSHQRDHQPGTTHSRVSFFMNKFRKLDLIDYRGNLEVHSSLLNVVLHD
jgi:hypothetical protein